MYFTAAIVVAIAWGAFAMGGVYAWAYAPLAGACTAIGIVGLVRTATHPIARLQARTTERRAAGGTDACQPDAKDSARAVATNAGEPAAAQSNLSWPLLAGLVLVAAGTALQIVPLPREVLLRVSPATDAFLRHADLDYAAAAGQLAHPISIEPASTVVALALFVAFAVFLIGLARGLAARDVRRLAALLIALGTLLALAGIIQKATWNGKIYGVWQTWESGVQPFGPFVNRNHFAGWMLMALPVGIGYFCALVGAGMRGVQRDWRHRALWFSSPEANRVVLVGVGLLVMGLSLVMTVSRSGIMGFAVALAASGWMVARRQARRSRRTVLAGYFVFLAALSVGWAGADAVAARFAKLQGDFVVRRAIWSDALGIFRDFPLLGSGAKTFGTAMLVYQTANPGVHYGEAHSDYVQLVAEGGVAIAAAALVLLVLFAREVRRRFRDSTGDETTYWIRVGAVTGLVAIALQEIGEFSLQMPGNAALFVMLMAIAAGKLPHRRKI